MFSTASHQPSTTRRVSMVKMSTLARLNDGWNPFKDDPQLKRLLDELLHSVDTLSEFNRWKTSFLNRFDNFLDASGSKAAQAAYDDYRLDIVKLGKGIHQLEGHVERQELTSDRATVKARKCLGELKARIIVATDGLADLLPGNGQADATKNAGYTNYHMGAILIGDGFSLYSYLSLCDSILEEYKESLERIADKQLLAAIDQYHKKLQIFCDVMADLGLYKAMMRARELLSKAEEEQEEETETELTSASISSTGETAETESIVSDEDSTSEEEDEEDVSEEPEPIIEKKPKKERKPIDKPTGQKKFPKLRRPKIPGTVRSAKTTRMSMPPQRMNMGGGSAANPRMSMPPQQPRKSSKGGKGAGPLRRSESDVTETARPASKPRSSLKAALASSDNDPTTGGGRGRGSEPRRGVARQRSRSLTDMSRGPGAGRPTTKPTDGNDKPTTKSPIMRQFPSIGSRRSSIAAGGMGRSSMSPRPAMPKRNSTMPNKPSSLASAAAVTEAPAGEEPQQQKERPSLPDRKRNNTMPNSLSSTTSTPEPAAEEEVEEPESPPTRHPSVTGTPASQPNPEPEDEADEAPDGDSGVDGAAEIASPPQAPMEEEEKATTPEAPAAPVTDAAAAAAVSSPPHQSAPVVQPSASIAVADNNVDDDNSGNDDDDDCYEYVVTIKVKKTKKGPKPRMVVMGHGEAGEGGSGNDADVVMGDDLQTNIVIKHVLQAMKDPDAYNLSYFMNVGM